MLRGPDFFERQPSKKYLGGHTVGTVCILKQYHTKTSGDSRQQRQWQIPLAMVQQFSSTSPIRSERLSSMTPCFGSGQKQKGTCRFLHEFAAAAAATIVFPPTAEVYGNIMTFNGGQHRR